MSCCCIIVNITSPDLLRITKQPNAQWFLTPIIGEDGLCYYEIVITDPGGNEFIFTLIWTNADGGQWNFVNNDTGNTLYYFPSEYTCPVSEFSQWVPTEFSSEFTLTDLYIAEVSCDEPEVTEPTEGNNIPNYDEFFSCKYTNLLKKKRADLALDVAANRNHEMFGLKGCEENWNNLYMRYLIIDALQCSPYGVYSEETERCLIGKLNENCNC